MSRQTSAKAVKKPELVAEFNEAPAAPKAKALAIMVLRPSVNAALVVDSYGKILGELDLGALTESLMEGIDRVNEGDLSRVEAMLFSQANALQSIFMSLARRANAQEYLSGMDPMLRLALKAQSQCRATLETLANIKNPPMVIARQANINNGGQQQVNNGALAPGLGSPAPAPASNSETEPNKLLEALHVERLDFGAQGAAVGTHQDLAPLGAVNRADQRGR